ncbi:MAG: hypothetical protein LH478_06770 [Chitinophagaceae bacterium]|nr:hypothetical protein [Chitinophagaceae bacterium]
MTKIFLLLLCLPLLTTAQNKNVTNATRVFPKADKIQEFEKAIGEHAQKYHKGDWSWRVFSIETGPDAGGYQFVEGPSTWAAFDGRGDLGKEHTDDWSKNVSVYLTERTVNSYAVAIDSLSTTPVTQFTDKIMIAHVYPKVGYGPEYIEHLRKIKKTWQAGMQTVVVYQLVASGRNGYYIVYRLKDGLKEFEDGYRKNFKERYETANGAGSYSGYLNNQRTIVNDETWSEILVLRPKLSSIMQ